MSTALQLAYAFASVPSQILASIPGTNPSTVDVVVMVSNATDNPIALKSITIQIPMGEEIAADLSSSASLPAPTEVSDTTWTIISAAGTVTLTPPPAITGSVSFLLAGIAVNQEPGTVQLTVTEMAPPAPRATDSTSYKLVKWSSQSPVTSFYAEPATLTNLDDPVTLYWTCDAQGPDYTYSVRSDGWQPRDCLGAGNCFQWADGVAGVQTPALNQTTVFSLDVISAATGTREVVSTLTTTAQLDVPVISPSSYATQYLASGRVVLLHWVAENAAFCTLSVDGVVVDAQAPLDSYVNGYPVVLNQPPGNPSVVLVAHAQTGGAQTSFTFPVTVGNLPSAVDSLWAQAGVATTPDSLRAFATLTPVWGAVPSVLPVELASLTAGTAIATSDVVTPSVDAMYSQVVITPDGATLLASNSMQAGVAVVDLTTATYQPPQIAAGGGFVPLALSPDGTTALVGTADSTLVAIDVATRQVAGDPIPISGQANTIAFIPPAGALALAGSVASGCVTLVDVKTFAAVQAFRVEGGSAAIAVTPDGTLALTVGPGNTLAFMDTATWTMEAATIATGNGPTGIAITPDGKVALVCNSADESVTAIAIAARAAAGDAISLAGNNPSGIAVTANGKYAAVSLFNGATVVI